MVRVRSAEALDGFRLRLLLTDGEERIVDVSPYLHGPIFEPLRGDRSLFAAVSVDPDFGTVVWPNGADIDPEVLLHGRTPVSSNAPTHS
jgi:hypothetical protein